MSTFERHTLDNGLRVLTANLDHAQSVTCMVMLAAGSRYETPDTNGIAHFSEHMFFKGTQRRPSARDIDGEEIEREKGVIIEEMNMYFDTPRDYIGGVYESLLYGDQPLGWDIIGRKETVRGATRDTFTSYLDHWYKPPRMVLGVAGRIGDDVLERAQELLGDIPGAETGAPEPARGYQSERVREFTK